jgi:hypothetical protein
MAKTKKSSLKKAVKRPKSSKPKSVKKAKSSKKPVKKQVSKPKKRSYGGLPAPARHMVIVYGMKMDPEQVAKAAVEAYNKRRYTVHDVRLTDHIEDPKFRNLMVKIAILDRIEEDIYRLYPEAEILRPNTVTLVVR